MLSAPTESAGGVGKHDPVEAERHLDARSIRPIDFSARSVGPVRLMPTPRMFHARLQARPRRRRCRGAAARPPASVPRCRRRRPEPCCCGSQRRAARPIHSGFRLAALTIGAEPLVIAAHMGAELLRGFLQRLQAACAPGSLHLPDRPASHGCAARAWRSPAPACPSARRCQTRWRIRSPAGRPRPRSETAARALSRWVCATASTLAWPASTAPRTAPQPAKVSWICPPTTSFTAGPTPRYGTCRMSTPAAAREHFAGEMRRGARPARAVAQLARLALGERHQLAQIVGRHLGIGDHQNGASWSPARPAPDRSTDRTSCRCRHAG